jgi:uncharacterized protein (TIGR02996 family)
MSATWDRSAFLEAIRARPEDDELRLVFADWLEEHGKDEWARVIRYQIRRLRPDPDGLERNGVWLAHTLLAAAFGTQPPDVDRLRAEMDYPVPFKAEQLDRGLVARLPIDAADFLEVGPALAAWGPVPCVGLTHVTPHLDALARCPALAAEGDRTFRLVLEGMSVGDGGMARLAARPELARCDVLWLKSNGITGHGAQVLASCPTLARLAGLDLSDNHLGDEGAIALADSPHLTGLRELRLGYCLLTDAGVAALAASRHLTGLKELTLFGNDLTEAGASALARAPWPNLESLHAGQGVPGAARAVLQERFGDRVTFL